MNQKMCAFRKTENRIKACIFTFLIIFIFSSCLSLRLFSLPYEINVQKDSFEEGDSILPFSFTSFSRKEVVSFCISLSICDQEGLSVLKGGEEVFYFGKEPGDSGSVNSGPGDTGSVNSGSGDTGSVNSGSEDSGFSVSGKIDEDFLLNEEYSVDFEDFLLPDSEGPFYLESINVIQIEYIDGDVWEDNFYF